MIEIKMPRLSDTMEEGAISTWRKHPGDSIAVGDVLVEIETDKAVMEYEAYQAGTLSKILVDEGQVVGIGAAIALVDDGSGAVTASAPEAPAQPAQPAADDNSKRPAGAGTASAGTGGSRPAASPLVRKLARENHLDLSRVRGSGPGGRIIRADISGLLPGAPTAAPVPAPRAPAAPATPAASPASNGPASTVPASTVPASTVPASTVPASTVPASTATGSTATGSTGPASTGPASTGPASTADGEDVRGSRSVPLSQVRRVIARRLSASAREIPHFYVTAAADAEELMSLRADLNARLTAAGGPVPGRGKISVNDLLIRAVALALRQHPEVNASYAGDSSTTMLIHDRVNIGVAVAAESGLIVPVIQDADTKTVTQLGAEARRLVALAAERKLTPAQASGGTFTISNLGMYGVEDFTAIINPPEAAILAVGATTREPAVAGDQVVARYRMRYTLSSDHRVIDGALAARFLGTLTSLVENPWLIVA